MNDVAPLYEFVRLVRAHRSPATAVETAGMPPANNLDQRSPINMPNATALTPIENPPTGDGWDAAATDASANPARGPVYKFDDGEYFAGREKTPLEDGKQFVVLDRVEGRQYLRKDCAPEWLLRIPAAAPKPEQPHVDKDKWPLDMNGKPAHPWKYTYFIYLLDAGTGEIGTFATNTIGGTIAVNDLRDQIKFMRNTRPGAVPIVSLQSRLMPTQFGTKKPRPHFKIEGWKIRGDEQPLRITSSNDDGHDAAKAHPVDDEIPF
jgi:hypothetical protein